MRVAKTISLTAMIDNAQLDSARVYQVLLAITPVDRFTQQQSGDVIRIVHTTKLMSDDSGNNDGLQTGGVTFRGDYYQPAWFDLSVKESQGDVSAVTLTITDITGLVRDQLDAFQGGVGFWVTMYVILDGEASNYEATERFVVTTAAVDGRNVSWSLGANNMLAMEFPRRKQRKDFCGHKYKDKYCRYAGPMLSCDYTLVGPNGCQAHGNNLNFGGFPGIKPRGS